MQQAQGNLRGIALMVAAMALFGIEDMFLKWAAADLPIGQVVFVSGAFGAPVFALMAWRAGARILTRAALHPAVLARNAGEMINKLTLNYNRTRQANITRELIEIISGAEAL